MLFKIDVDVFAIRLMFLPYWLMVLTILWLMLLPLDTFTQEFVPLVIIMFG